MLKNIGNKNSSKLWILAILVFNLLLIYFLMRKVYIKHRKNLVRQWVLHTYGLCSYFSYKIIQDTLFISHVIHMESLRKMRLLTLCFNWKLCNASWGSRLISIVFQFLIVAEHLLSFVIQFQEANCNNVIKKWIGIFEDEFIQT